MAKRDGGSRGQKRASKARARRGRLAREERRREEHARLVAERSGDPRFVQRTTDSDGRTTISWPRETPNGRELGASLEAQAEAFRQKFGRAPGPDDPLLFDPDAELPTPITEQYMTEKLDELVTTLESRGEDAVFVKAWRDLGYVVTTENQHTFSAAEIEAWEDTVAFYDDDVWADEDDEEVEVDELVDLLDAMLRDTVGRTVSEPSAEPARHIARLIHSGGDCLAGPDAEDGAVLSFTFAVLAGWLTGARERDPATAMAADAVAWVRSEIGDGPADSAVRAGALLGPPSPAGADLTVQQLADALGEDFLPALLWLSAGAVARFGGGDPAWLPALDRSDHEDG